MPDGVGLGRAGLEALVENTTFRCVLAADSMIGLDLSANGLDGDAVAFLLARDEILRGLSHLNLAENYLGDRGAEHLARSENLGNLRHLELNATGIEHEGVVALANPENIGLLKHLGLGCGRHTDWGESAGAWALSTLGKAEFLRGLEHLDVSICGIGSQGAHALASASFMPNLRSLDVSLNHIDIDGLRALVHATEYMERLDLSASGLDAGELATIIDHDGLRGLISLELRHNRVGDRGLSTLANAEHLRNLRRLNLAANHISPAGVAELVDSPLMPNLRELVLRDHAIGDQGAETLASAQSTRALRVLDLERTRIGDRGAQAIAQSENLAGVVDLQLGLNQIGDTGAVALADSEHSRGLEQLSLTANDRIGERGAAALQASPHIPCEGVFAYPVRIWCEMDNASSYNNHAWLRCHDLGQCDELAETNVRKALKLSHEQDRHFYLDTLALILCQQGNTTEANEAYRKACEADPDGELCGNSC